MTGVQTCALPISPGNTVRVHQHRDIGQGEVPWETFFGTLGELEFDGIMTVCVFAWEERARESSQHNLAQIARHTAAWGKRT